jgi:hypothetical protein
MSEEREQKNQIFTSTTGPTSTNTPSISAADKVRSDFGLDIPVEIVPLPSGGKVYPAGHPLSGKETVEIRAMTAREEDILTSRALLKKGTVISELIKSCVIDKAINPTDLLSGDRNALMVAIRITGYGQEYDAEIECSECNVKSAHQFNLASLPIKSLDIEPVAPGMNSFEFVLPSSKKTVKFKFMSGRDEEEILMTQERQKKLGMNTDSSVTTSLMYSIISIDGIEDRSKIAGFVRMMPARDSLALRNYIKNNEPGISMKQETICTSCGHSEEVNMPIGISFLWPSDK